MNNINKTTRNTSLSKWKTLSGVLLTLSLCSCSQMREFVSSTTKTEEATVVSSSQDEADIELATSSSTEEVTTILPTNFEPAPALVATPLPDDSDSWTLAELQQMAESQHPTIQRAMAALNTAHGVHKQVGLKPNPVIGYTADEMGDDGTAGRQGVYLSQTIVTGDKLTWNRYVVQQEMAALQWELETERTRVRNDVRLKYYEVLGTARKLRLTIELEKTVHKGVETTQALEKAKQVAMPDVLQAEIQWNEVQILKENAKYDYETAWKELATLVGNPQMPPMPINETLSKPASQRNWEQSYQQLLAASPQLQTAYARTQRAAAQISRQQAQTKPNILTQLSLTHDTVSGDELTSVSVGIPLQIFNKNQGNIDQACSEHHRTTWQAQQLEMALRVKLLGLFRDYQKSQHQVERFETMILPKAKQNLSLTEKAYEQGELGLMRVLTARRSYTQANMKYIDALMQLNKSDILIEGMMLSGSLSSTSSSPYSGSLNGTGLRGQALSGQ